MTAGVEEAVRHANVGALEHFGPLLQEHPFERTRRRLAAQPGGVASAATVARSSLPVDVRGRESITRPTREACSAGVVPRESPGVDSDTSRPLRGTANACSVFKPLASRWAITAASATSG